MESTYAGWLTCVIGMLTFVVWLLWWWNELWYVMVPTLKARSTTRIKSKLPPGHMGFPFFGELITFLWYFKILGRPDDFITSKRQKYGDGVGMYRTYLFGYPTIIACSSAVNKFVLQADDAFPYRWPTNDLVGHKSIIAVLGKSHTRLRNFVSAAINQPKALRRIALLNQPRIAASLQSWADKGTVITYDEMKKVTLENIGRLFVSFEPGPLLDKLDHYFGGMVKGVRAQPISFPGTAYHHALRCRKKLVSIFRKELEKRKQNQQYRTETRNDLMDGLIQMKDDNGQILSDEEVLDNIVSLVVGGYESTTLASMWGIYFLAKYPNVLQKLREENMAISKRKNGDLITSEDISQMKYTNKVVEETLRLANVASFVFRSGDEDVEFQGHVIPKGWKVILWLRYLHTDSKNFEDPMCFNPDRWNQPPKPGTYLVFGGGSRICAGNMLSRIQIAILFHHLSIGYRWELINSNAKITYLPHPKPVDGAKISIRRI